MILVELQFLDRSLTPTAPTGTKNLPRNALIGMVFSELVDPTSVTNQTIQLRFGGSFQSVPTGSFSVNGNQVLFDPTVTAAGQPNPLGFEPVTQYVLDIPSFEEQNSVVRNLDDDPNLTTFFTEFTTSEGWLRELVPPEVEDVIWIPEEDPLTKNIPGNGIMGIVFSEPMDPTTFALKLSAITEAAKPEETVDVRYTLDDINVSNLVAGAALFGSFSPSADYETFFFRPMFSFGSAKLVFTVQVFQGVTDLSGNLLVNPSSFGPYTCDGTGIVNGKVITETFVDLVNSDGAATDADWGSTDEGTLAGQPVTSRKAYIYSYVETDNGSNSGRGQYAPIIDPLIGASIKQYLPNLTPPSSLGRRVMWAFSDVKMGAKGSITAVGWGPDSNATFAASYKNIKLRIGYQKTNSLSLAPSFSGNYEGQPSVIYSGDYDVEQKANVGNEPGEPQWSHQGGYAVNPGCTGGWNAPLFVTGWYAWPTLTTFFEWDPGDPAVDNDRVLIFDASVPEGDVFQQVRGWFGVTYPCSGVLIGGLPLTRMYATYEEDVPNPESNFVAGIQNPEQSLTDTVFTVTRRVSIAQSKFYVPGPGNNETFDTATDYRPAILSPQVQSGGAQVVIEYQGAQAVEADRVTLNPAQPYTDWVQDINDCDGYACLRWRVSLISNLTSLKVAKLNAIVIPMTSSGP
jgi:hypothetical protein